MADEETDCEPLSVEAALSIPPLILAEFNARVACMRSDLEQKKRDLHQQSNRGQFKKRANETQEAFKYRKRESKMSVYVETYCINVALAVLDPDQHAIIDLGFTTQETADGFLHGPRKKPLILIYLNQELVGSHLSGSLAFPEMLRDDYSAAYNRILKFYGPKLPQASTISHSNKYPERVSLSGIIDNTLGFMNGHHMDLSTRLKIREERRKTSDKLTESLSYLEQTKNAAKVMDGLNELLFQESTQRKASIYDLVRKYDDGSIKLLESNGGFPIRYLALNVFNKGHHDRYDCDKIPSSLLYSGVIPKKSCSLLLSDYGISLPVRPWTILQMKASKLNHEVEIAPKYTTIFKDRRVEVFGSYRTIHQNFLTRDSKKMTSKNTGLLQPNVADNIVAKKQKKRKATLPETKVTKKRK